MPREVTHPLLEVRKISKHYGRTEALREVSFTAPDHQIVGLLGVNGAGKTTALNILTGYLPPSSGEVLLDGISLGRDPRSCKRQIGYLPERPPLYDEMTVRAYLTFVCRIREVQRADIPAHIQEILGLCGLSEVAHRVLGHLSKGYRQRVGIASALCASPRLIVLDEPTVGLDPRQVVEIRQLIRQLGQTRTVLFSSHLLSEVQQLCQRVVILHHGRVIREMDLREEGQQDRLRLRCVIASRPRELLPALHSLPCVQRALTHTSQRPDETHVTLECLQQPGQPDPQTQLFHLLAGLDAPLRLLTPEQGSLEDIFLRATAQEEV